MLLDPEKGLPYCVDVCARMRLLGEVVARVLLMDDARAGARTGDVGAAERSGIDKAVLGSKDGGERGDMGLSAAARESVAFILSDAS